MNVVAFMPNAFIGDNQPKRLEKKKNQRISESNRSVMSTPFSVVKHIIELQENS